jgi:hypothetical protein
METSDQPDALILEDIASSFHWKEGWMGPKANLDMVPKRKILAHLN